MSIVVLVNDILAPGVAAHPTGKPDNIAVPAEYRDGPAAIGLVIVTEISHIAFAHPQLVQLRAVEPPLFVTVTLIGFPGQPTQLGFFSRKLMSICKSQARLLLMVTLQL